MKFLVIAAVLLLAVNAEKKTFHGDKVVQVHPANPKHHGWLKAMQQNVHHERYDFWTPPVGVGVPVDIRIRKDHFNHFHHHTKAMGLNYTVMIPDLQKVIDKTEAPINARKRRSAPWKADIVGTFARYQDIYEWGVGKCSEYPTLTKCESLGLSYEGRDIVYIKLGKALPGKKTIFIQAGIHAREWLSPATMIYIVNKLLTTYDSDPDAKYLLDTYNFIVVPSSNPDGYEYSHNTDRMWRKTRSNYGTFCTGVDPNRNYDASWGGQGTSGSPCSDIYRGPSAFSEKETKALSDYISANKDDILAFFDVHTYSQLWLIPYADRRNHYVENFDEQKRVADIGGKALMAVNSKYWKIGNTVDVLSAAAGGSDDWAATIGIKYTYTLELRPDGSSYNGFVVDESEITPSGEEVWAGLVAAIRAMEA